MAQLLKKLKVNLKRTAAWTFVFAAAASGSSVYSRMPECISCARETKAPKVLEKIVKKQQVARQRVRLAREFAPDSDGSLQEKAIAVSPKVFVSVCVRRGAVRVNGWSRNEVRVFHKGGEELGIRVLEKDAKEVPAWVEVLGYDPESRPKETDKCLSGDMIEMDVPENASVTIKGLSSETSVERVKSAAVEIVGGDIYLSGISERVEASTQQGGVTVNNSLGRMNVSTTTGNIVAYNTQAVEPGDFFRAKTRSGAITLQSIGQREVAASTISGSINYVGEIRNFGRYDFTTTNGILNLLLPDSSTFWLTAAYGGDFDSDFPVTTINENVTEGAYYIKGRVGTGEANLSLKSFSGTIRIRKKDPSERKDMVIVIP